MDTIYSVERGKRAHQLTHVIIGLQARLALPARLHTNSPVRSVWTSYSYIEHLRPARVGLRSDQFCLVLLSNLSAKQSQS